MSVIVLVKDNDRFVIGSDIRTSCDNGFYTDMYRGNKKIRHLDINKEIIIGCVGNVAMLDTFDTLINKLNVIDRKSLVNNIVPALMKSFKSTVFECGNGLLDGELVIASGKKAFVITSNYNVIEIEDTYVLGSGSLIALGTLFVTEHFNLTPEERVEIAIRAAGTYVNTVSKEAVIGDTKGNDIKAFSSNRFLKKSKK